MVDLELSAARLAVPPEGARAARWSAQAKLRVIPRSTRSPGRRTGAWSTGTLGGAFSFASGVSPNGQVVGMSLIASGANHAFSWTRNSGMIDLGTLGGTFSTASGVNASGMVAGQSQIAGNTALHATVWRMASIDG